MKRTLLIILLVSVQLLFFQNCGNGDFEAEYYGQKISSSSDRSDNNSNGDDSIGGGDLNSDNPPTIPGQAKILFTDHFDDQPDWTSTMHSTSSSQKASEGDILPNNWFELYQGTKWSPETGFQDNHASLEILAKNNDKAKGGVGKSAVMWRESFSLSWRNWASDSQLVKYLGEQYNEMYIEFYIRFGPEFYGRNNKGPWTSKIFRVGSYRGTGNIVSGFQGDIGPIAFYDYKRDNYGIRNVNAFRGGPHGENYMFNGEYKGGSRNYVEHTSGHGFNGEDPKIPDLINGGYLIDAKDIVTHEQVYGPHQTWTKLGFYVKMNSSPGAKDGIYRQYINDEQMVNREDIPWIQENTENKMVGWNYFAIGGNDYFQAFPNEDRFEDWYAIDDVLVLDGLPDTLKNK